MKRNKGKKPGARSALEIRIAKRLEKLINEMSPLNYHNMSPDKKIELIEHFLAIFQDLSEETVQELTDLKNSLGGVQAEDSGGSNPPGPGQPGHP